MTTHTPLNELLKMIKNKEDYNLITDFYYSYIHNNYDYTDHYQYVDENGNINREIIINDLIYTIYKEHYTTYYNKDELPIVELVSI